MSGDLEVLYLYQRNQLLQELFEVTCNFLNWNIDLTLYAVLFKFQLFQDKCNVFISSMEASVKTIDCARTNRRINTHSFLLLTTMTSLTFRGPLVILHISLLLSAGPWVIIFKRGMFSILLLQPQWLPPSSPHHVHNFQSIVLSLQSHIALLVILYYHFH